jgi:hypothetical protein
MATNLPNFELEDSTVFQSDRSGSAGLYVRVCELPLCAHFITMERSESAYHFYYRPRAEKGDAWLTIQALGVAGRRNDRDLLLIPHGIRAG